jgi:hypothetical protein
VNTSIVSFGDGRLESPEQQMEEKEGRDGLLTDLDAVKELHTEALHFEQADAHDSGCGERGGSVARVIPEGRGDDE